MDKYGNTTDQLRAGVRAMREMADSGFDISKEISEVRELAKEKIAAFEDFREKVEKVVEYNQNLRCALAEAIAENERLKAKNARLELRNSELRRCVPALSTIATVSSISTGDIVLREINRIAKEALK